MGNFFMSVKEEINGILALSRIHSRLIVYVQLHVRNGCAHFIRQVIKLLDECMNVDFSVEDSEWEFMDTDWDVNGSWL